MFDFQYVHRLMKAGANVFGASTVEYVRLKRALAELTKKASAEESKEPYELLTWDIEAGGPQGKGEDALQFLTSLLTKKRQIALLINAHWVLKQAPIVQFLSAHIYDFNEADIFIWLNTLDEIPRELKPYVNVVPFELPTDEDLGKILDKVLRDNSLDIKIERTEEVIRNARSLTHYEAESTFCLGLTSSVKKGPKSSYSLDESKLAETVLREKERSIRQSGVLEVFDTKNLGFDQVGGLGTLKEYLRRRRRAFSNEAREYGLPLPKGILVLGPPGTGKSLVSKCVARELGGVPVCRLDIGKFFGSLVGQSEGQVRGVLQKIDSLGPVVAWFDEIEKGLSGIGSSGATDSGVTARVLSTLLQWMGDRTSSAYIVATANDVQKLLQSAPEFLRKGRFDEIFWVDLPNAVERIEIFKILLRKYNRTLPEDSLEDLATVTEKFTGAEIEGALVNALYMAFDQSLAELTPEILTASIRSTKTLWHLDSKKIESMRDWAKGRCVFASAAEDSKVLSSARKVSI